MRLRQGRKVPRNLYLHDGDDPDGTDVGRVDYSAGLAWLVCVVFNACLPRCVVLCRDDCGHGPAHCMWAHAPAWITGRHSRDECPWERMTARAAAGKEGEG